MENNTLFVCQCGEIDHQIVLSFDPDPDFNDTIWFHVHLSDMGLWNRIKYAFLYVLGKKSRYGCGAFAEVLFTKKETKNLIDTLTKHYETMT
jgi:hypothetical protein